LSRLVIRSVASAVFRDRSILPYPSPASLSNSPDSFPFLPSRQTLSSDRRTSPVAARSGGIVATSPCYGERFFS
jgi:hypothetical protein